MRKTFVLLYLLFLVPFLAIVILIKSHAAESPAQSKEGFELTYADGKVTRFTKDKFSDKLILYFFDSRCDLCYSEVEEIMSFANAQKIQVLFVTTEELTKVKTFEREIKFKGARSIFSIAQIKKDDVAKIFNAQFAPQAILFGPQLEIKGVREEIISIEFLEGSFE